MYTEDLSTETESKYLLPTNWAPSSFYRSTFSRRIYKISLMTLHFVINLSVENLSIGKMRLIMQYGKKK